MFDAHNVFSIVKMFSHHVVKMCVWGMCVYTYVKRTNLLFYCLIFPCHIYLAETM